MKLIRIAKTTKYGYEQYDFHDWRELPNGKFRLFDTGLANPNYFVLQQHFPYRHIDVKAGQVYFKNKLVLTKTERAIQRKLRDVKRVVKDVEQFRNYDYYDYKFRKRFKLSLTLFLMILTVLAVVLLIIIL